MISSDLKNLVKRRGLSTSAVGRLIGYRCQGGPQRFMRGTSQLRLDVAERLAAGLGFELRLMKRVNGSAKATARAKHADTETPTKQGENEHGNNSHGGEGGRE